MKTVFLSHKAMRDIANAKAHIFPQTMEGYVNREVACADGNRYAVMQTSNTNRINTLISGNSD